MSVIPDRDLIQRFIFEKLAIRGEITRLSATWQEINQRHEYPENIAHLLGEMTAAVTLLSATIKFKGSLIMQVQGDGPVSMAVVECSSERTIRGLAHWREEDIADKSGLSELIGKGTLAITIDRKEGDRYQGIVDVGSGDLAAALQEYMAKSQQLQTLLWLHSDAEHVSGMLLQKLPGSQFKFEHELDADTDAWNRVTQLANTVTDEELAELSFINLLHRLFHEEDVTLFDAEPVSFRCTCSRERVRNVLRMLGYDDVKSILQSEGKVGANCQFCNQRYEFDAVDVEEVFATDIPNDPSSMMH